MPVVSKEQIARAKEWDLPSYLQRYEPDELVRTSPHEYSTATHGSLKISNGKWHWFKGEMGGKDALSYLVRVRGMGFVEAVELLSDGIGGPPLRVVQPAEASKPFRLPEAARFPAYVLSYLQKRGICGDIIRACIEANVLYESKRYHKALDYLTTAAAKGNANAQYTLAKLVLEGKELERDVTVAFSLMNSAA
jgi:hypothetical protein